MRTLRRDLLERKLWPVVALLVAALVAVPVLLLKGTPAGGSALPPAPPAATTASQTATTTQTTSNAPAKVVLARIARNPFASGVPKLSSKPSSSSQSSSSSTSGGSSSTASGSSGSGSSGASGPSMVSPSPSGSATSGSSSAVGSTSSGSSSATPTSTTPTSTVASVTPTPSGTQSTQAQSWTIYSVSIQFSRTGRGPVHNDIPRLTALPSAGNPQLMFFGVMSGGRQAVFGLGAGVAHAGPGLCRPSRSSCSAIVLSAGDAEEVAWPTATGAMAQAFLHVHKITGKVTHSRKEALKAYKRVSSAGICDLSLAQPVSYDPDTGTVQSFPKDACKAQASSAPFAFFKPAP